MTLDILNFFEEDFKPATLITYDSATMVDGEYQKGVATNTPILIQKPQPLTGEQLRILPEGVSPQDYKTTWSRDAIPSGAYLNYNGILYKVFGAEDWSEEGLYEETILRRVQE